LGFALPYGKSEIRNPKSAIVSSADKTHRTGCGDKVWIVDAVTRFFFQSDVLDELDQLGPRGSASKVIAEVMLDS
jgi:hypothetical protein